MKNPQNPFQSTFDEDAILQENRVYMIMTYAFFLLGIAGLSFGTLVGVIMAYMKRRQVVNTLYESHLTYLIRTFWLSLLALVLFGLYFGFFMLPFWAINAMDFYFNPFGFFSLQWGMGIIAVVLFPLWYIGRLLYGFIRLLHRQGVNPYGFLC